MMHENNFLGNVDISVDESPRGVDNSAPDTLEESSTAGEKFQENTKDLSEKARESVSTMSQPASGTKGKMQRA